MVSKIMLLLQKQQDFLYSIYALTMKYVYIYMLNEKEKKKKYLIAITYDLAYSYQCTVQILFV